MKNMIVATVLGLAALSPLQSTSQAATVQDVDLEKGKYELLINVEEGQIFRGLSPVTGERCSYVRGPQVFTEFVVFNETTGATEIMHMLDVVLVRDEDQ